MHATPSTAVRTVLPQSLRIVAVAVALFAIAMAGVIAARESGQAGSQAATAGSPAAQHEATAEHERMGHAVAHPTSGAGATMSHRAGNQVIERGVSVEAGMVAPTADGVAQPRAEVITY